MKHYFNLWKQMNYLSKLNIIKTRAYLSCLAASLFFFYVLFLMGMLNTMSQRIILEVNITHYDFSFLSASYFLADAVFLIPAGILLDRYNTRRLLLFSFLICISAHLYFAIFNSLISLWTYRIVSGISNSFAFLGIIRYASSWFPNKRGFATSIMITIGVLGGVVSQAPLAFLLEHVKLRDALIISIWIGFLLWLFALGFLEDNKSIKTQERLFFYWGLLKQALQRPQNWLCAVFASLLNLVVSLLSATWSNLYLVQNYKINNIQATGITSMILVGVIFGAPVIGYFSDYFKSRKKTMIIGSFAALLIMLYIIMSPYSSISLLHLSFFLLGFFSSTQVISYPIIVESNPEVLISAATSIIAIMINLIATLSYPLFGWLTQSMVAEDRVVNYQHGMWILPVAMIISLIISFIIKEPAEGSWACKGNINLIARV